MSVVPAPPLDLATVIVRLTDLGPPSEIRQHAPRIMAEALDFQRVLLTSIHDSALVAEALYIEAGRTDAMLERLREKPVAIEYPLIEGEIMRRRRAQVVRTHGEANGQHAFAHVLVWNDYVAAPISLDGRVIGFFHADRESSVEDEDARNLAALTICFALVFERAVLRHRLYEQRQEMRQVATWAEARTSELGDRSVVLGEESMPATRSVQASGSGEEALRDLLTRRELEVLRLMVRGDSNSGIAKELVVSEGTVKFHVKNILRKLHAANRAEATSRYLRLTLRGGAG